MNPLLVGLLFGAVVTLFARAVSGPAPPAKGKPRKRTMNEALLAAALELVPDASTVLRPGVPILDVVYGGRKADAFGGPSWGYYSTYIGVDPDGVKRSGGTTCSTVLAYLMAKAGWPADMIDRLPTDPAPGSGFTPGTSMTKIVFGAKKHGYYLETPAPDGWTPGDAYHVDHPPKPNSDHVGEVVSVGGARADGTREIVTIDGGQGAGADVKQNTRILSADGKTLTLNGVPARVLGLIRASQQAVA